MIDLFSWKAVVFLGASRTRCFWAVLPSVCVLRSLHPNWTPGLHPVLQPGHGGLQADRAPGEAGHRGRVVRLVLSHSLAVLQPGGGQRPAADVGRQNHPDEAVLWFRHGHAVGSRGCGKRSCAELTETSCSVPSSVILRAGVVNVSVQTKRVANHSKWISAGLLQLFVGWVCTAPTPCAARPKELRLVKVSVVGGRGQWLEWVVPAVENPHLQDTPTRTSLLLQPVHTVACSVAPEWPAENRKACWDTGS